MSTVDDAYDRHTDSEWDEHLRAVEERRLERLREHVTPDPRPVKRTKRSEAPKADRVFRDAVLERDQGCCVHSNPAECEWPFVAHHVVPQQLLRREDLAEYLWEPRVGICLCSLAHRQAHNGRRPVFRDEVHVGVRLFVQMLGLDWYLNRHYPLRPLSNVDPGDESEAA